MAKIGIDLGTTNSVVAIIGTAGARILDNTEGENMTPSVVSFRKDEIIVGSVAKKRLTVDPLNTVFSVKRLMGRGFKDEEVQKMQKEVPFSIIQPSNGTPDSVAVILNKQEYSPVDVSSMILSKIKADVEHRLGENVKDAVITVPAYFSEIQKHATREAGIKAGFNVLRILDEPTAAAISYGIYEEGNSTDTKIALVYDLGGGTFDISVLAITAGSVVQLNLEGDMWMGGDNFDKVIIDQIVQDLKDKENIIANDDPKLMAIIKNEAQKAKEILGAQRAADIYIDVKGIEYETQITREQFNSKIIPLINKCDMLVDKAIIGAGFAGPDDIDIVIMAGNSTLIPAVQLHMEAKFGKEKIKRKLHPKLCVAEGAAMAAAMVPVGEIICPSCNSSNSEKSKSCQNCPYVFADVEESVGNLPFAYGIEQVGDKFVKFYEKNTPYPIKPENQVTKIAHTSFDNQRMLKIHILGGEFEKASQNGFQGEVFSVLPHGLASGTGVKIKLWINKDGLFELQTMLETGEGLPSIILRGRADTKAVNNCYTKLTDYSESKGVLSNKKQSAIEKQLEEALNYLKNGEYEKTVNLIDKIDLTADIETLPPENPIQAAQNALNMINGFINKYGEFVEPTDKYALRGLIERLSNAINNRNISECQSITNEAFKTLDSLMYTTMEGQQVPTPLGMVVMTESMLMQAESLNPAKARPLWDKFNIGKEKLKNHDFTGSNDLLDVFLAAQAILGNVDPTPRGMINCPHCGRATAKNELNCRYCGKPIILGGSGSSKDYLKNSLSFN